VDVPYVLDRAMVLRSATRRTLSDEMPMRFTRESAIMIVKMHFESEFEELRCRAA